MQVNVFIPFPQQDSAATPMLILPDQADAIVPNHMRHIEWRYFATVQTGDGIIGLDKDTIEAALARDGYLVARSGSI